MKLLALEEELIKVLAEEKSLRYEKFNGDIFMMSPRPAVKHNIICGNIFNLFKSFLKGKRCKTFVDGVDVHLDTDNTVIPDAMIVCNKDIIKHDGIYGSPDLIAEVLSPSTAKKDRGLKKDLYEKNGVKEYWIVSPSDKTIEVYLLKGDKYTLDNVYIIYPDWQLAKMTDEEKAENTLSFKISLYDDLIINVADVFEDVD